MASLLRKIVCGACEDRLVDNFGAVDNRLPNRGGRGLRRAAVCIEKLCAPRGRHRKEGHGPSAEGTPGSPVWLVTAV